MESRPMIPNDVALLRTLLKIDENTPLPEALVDLYWKVTNTFRRVQENITPKDLAWMVLLLDRPTPTDPVSFLEIVKDKGVKRGDRVLAYDDKDWKAGKYVGTKNRQILVALDGKGDSREFGPTVVRLPDRLELALIGE